MLMLESEQRSAIGNSFTRDGDVIHVVLAGPQNGRIVEDAIKTFERHVSDITKSGKKPLVYVDITHLELRDISVEARLAIKEAFRQPYRALAAVGKTRLLEVAMYLINASGANQRVRYFTSEHKAKKWLMRRRVDSPNAPYGTIVAALSAFSLGFIGLLGWLLNNPYLTRIIPSVRPINPMAAVGLLILALGIFALRTRKRWISDGVAVILMAIGLLALLPVNGNFDFWLFTNAVHATGAHATLADSGAVSFIAMGIFLLLSERGEPRMRRVMQLIILGGVLLLGLANAYGLAYATNYIYNLEPSFVMAVPLSIAFIFSSIALSTGVLQSGHEKTVFRQFSKLSWLFIASLVLLQIATYIAWQESTNHTQSNVKAAFTTRVSNIQDDLIARLQAYSDALRGFRGLYAASDYVNQGEFEAYYRTTGIATHYPGLRTISFIAKVPTNELAAYVAQHRSDTSLVATGHPSLQIQSQSANNIHYLATYIAGTPSSSSFGLDLADTPSRVSAFTKASATDDLVASNTVTIGTPSQNGFFVTVPVHQKYASSDTLGPVVGFVNVVFIYKDLFTNLLGTNKSLMDNVQVSIFDATDQTHAIYSLGHTDTTMLKQTLTVPVADRTWSVIVTATNGFAADQSRLYQPAATFVTGQLLTILLAIIFLTQNGARRRALQLADTITADLQHERNQAVEAQQKDEAIFSDIAEGLIICDKHGNIVRINSATKQLLGFNEQDLLNTPLSSSVVAYDQNSGLIPQQKRPITLTLERAEVVRDQVRYQRNDGSLIDVTIVCSPIVIDGVVQGAVQIFNDITEQQQLERSKTEFVSLASHQLRTPISAISWFAEMLLNKDAGKLNNEQTDYVTQIYTSNRRSAAIVDALLLASGLELGNLQPEPEPIDIPELCQTIIRTQLDNLPVNKKLHIEQHHEIAHKTIEIDPQFAQAVLTSILSNAMKYTPSGGTITVTTREDKLSMNKHFLTMIVSDTGYGIPKSEQPNVFKKLYRASNIKEKDTDGTGLGLYITKRVLEKIGGEISFKSEEHKGTTFTVRLPIDNSNTKKGID